MKIKKVMRVKVKKPHGMSHQGIYQEVNYCKVDQEVDWVQCHLKGGNMGTTPQGGNQWEANVHPEVGQDAREEHGNR
ncbi:hypothetical protein KY285_000941 [Solanum tuberosum]|nr:hypothetical protein KY285_000941 [Solanum tuberosum]